MGCIMKIVGGRKLSLKLIPAEVLTMILIGSALLTFWALSFYLWKNILTTMQFGIFLWLAAAVFITVAHFIGCIQVDIFFEPIIHSY